MLFAVSCGEESAISEVSNNQQILELESRDIEKPTDSDRRCCDYDYQILSVEYLRGCCVYRIAVTNNGSCTLVLNTPRGLLGKIGAGKSRVFNVTVCDDPLEISVYGNGSSQSKICDSIILEPKCEVDCCDPGNYQVHYNWIEEGDGDCCGLEVFILSTVEDCTFWLMEHPSGKPLVSSNGGVHVEEDPICAGEPITYYISPTIHEQDACATFTIETDDGCNDLGSDTDTNPGGGGS